MKRSLYRPAGVDEPEVCFCGHYSFTHGLACCLGWAHPDHCWQGRLSWSLLGVRLHISMRCPCDYGWVQGQLIKTPDYL